MDVHWRNTQKPARFFFVDARAVSSVLLFLVHARTWTFVLVVVVMIVFWLLERGGLTFDSALRALRSWVLGSNRPGSPRRARRRWVDFLGS